MCFFFEKFVMPYITKSNADVISDRNKIRNKVSALTCKYHCGKCSKLCKEDVTCDSESSINCECMCGCSKWFRWVCVGYKPSKVGQDADEPAWFCQDCCQLCGAAANK
ncbi:hypothetical protein DPMN_007183 [Dreissena polymorpha]|uniref:Uncharacterized protein n=1 Tax=Dreissena polymorpha TaxID=45954 RepID=A0A9D4RW67_DREPO|nr:hypothetical protein DPMN_007183 [Dreissena polymorpha]